MLLPMPCIKVKFLSYFTAALEFYFLDGFDKSIDSTSFMRNSQTRLIRVSLAVFLCKMQHGLSNQLLTTLFFLRSKRSVSWITH